MFTVIVPVHRPVELLSPDFRKRARIIMAGFPYKYSVQVIDSEFLGTMIDIKGFVIRICKNCSGEREPDRQNNCVT